MTDLTLKGHYLTMLAPT